MKSKLFKQAKDEIRSLKLLPEERINILDNILVSDGHDESYYWATLFWFRRQLVPAAALILVVALGAGTSFAAEGAVPGDLLYPVKIKINEPVRNVVKLSPEAKAHWEEERVNRRLKEAETLAAREKLDETTRSQIETLLEAHVKDFENTIKEVEGFEDNEQIKKAQTELNKTINDYSDKLEKEDKDEQKTWGQEQQKELRKIETKIKEKKQKIRELPPESKSERSGGDGNVSGQNWSPREESNSVQKIKEEERRRDPRDYSGKEEESKNQLEDTVDDDLSAGRGEHGCPLGHHSNPHFWVGNTAPTKPQENKGNTNP